MHDLPAKLKRRLQQRAESDGLRELALPTENRDFWSNDYLGLAREEDLRQALMSAWRDVDTHGATGSRLISGHHRVFEETERQLADFHRAADGLIFNSGYDANLGLLSCVPQRGDSILFDRQIHASMRDGIRLAPARHAWFSHNDLNHLEDKLKRGKSLTYVAVESIYSMSGELAPLTEIVDLCQRFGARLIVDEAHATGVFGERGQGMVAALGLEDGVFARVHTFGKALGAHGAAVLGSPDLKAYLINFARSLIYTTALPPHAISNIQLRYQYLRDNPQMVQELGKQVDCYRQLASGIGLSPSPSPIQPIPVAGNAAVLAAARSIRESGFDVAAMRYPTVPHADTCLRVCLHRFNSELDIRHLVDRLQQLLPGTA